jgi:hypothetical protein
MAKKRMSVSFSDEAIFKIQALAEARCISFASATNEMLLRGNDAFQVAVHNLIDQVDVMSSRVIKMEANLATATDVLSSIVGSLDIISLKIKGQGEALNNGK